MTKSKITITEALAEANNGKLIDRKIVSERDFVLAFAWRQQAVADRLSSQGGEAENVKKKMQSINDLFERKIAILSAVKRANAENTIEVNGTKRTIEEWLLWKQYVVATRKSYLESVIKKIDEGRSHAQKMGGSVIDMKVGTEFSPNVIVNLDEVTLRDELTKLQETLDKLDGQLSLKNATIKIEV